jgi:hypothetical protein
MQPLWLLGRVTFACRAIWLIYIVPKKSSIELKNPNVCIWAILMAHNIF